MRTGLARGHRHACGLVAASLETREKKAMGDEQRKILVRQCSVFYAFRQNMLRRFAPLFDKNSRVQLEAGGHTAIQIILDLLVISNVV